MKKIFITATLICTLALGMTACGGSNSLGGGSSAGASAGAAAAEEEGGNAAAETVDVGEFTITVPANWFGFTQTDFMQETDEDGNYPVSTHAYGMIKEGKDTWDAFTKPCVYIYYYDDTSAEQEAGWAIWAYDESEEIDVKVNGTKASAYRVSSDYSEEKDGSQVYVYDIVLVPVTENSCLQYTITVSTPDFEGVSADDADVMEIMESAKVK